MDSSYKGKGFKTNSRQINAEGNILGQKIFFSCYQIVATKKVSVCLDVRSLTTPTFIDRFVQKWYLLNPHIKGRVLRLLQNK